MKDSRTRNDRTNVPHASMLPSNPASGHTVNLQAVSNKQHQVFGTATDKEFDGCKRYITALQGLRVDLKEMGAGLT
jgi:hypothetical protein